MSALYQMLGLSKQAHFKARTRAYAKQVVAQQVVNAATELRKQNPGMGCRSMYDVVGQAHPIGRDGFESILLDNGFRVRYPRNYIKTTRSAKGRYFDNLSSGKRLDGINQLWQTDITYLWANNQFYYLVFIIDVYSRRIIAHQAHANMLADANIKALKQALSLRAGASLAGLVHHSDRGAQFTDKRYLNLLDQAQIIPSMAKECWENAYVERVNGTIKNQYLNLMDVGSLAQLRRKLTNAVNCYNNVKPHHGLPKRLTPNEFEYQLGTGQIKPPKVTVYSQEFSTFKQLSTKRKRSKKKKITSSSIN